MLTKTFQAEISISFPYFNYTDYGEMILLPYIAQRFIH